MITITVGLTPEAEALLREMTSALRDVRNALSRVGWNQLARAESAAGANPGAPASVGDGAPAVADPIAPAAEMPPAPQAAPEMPAPAQAGSPCAVRIGDPAARAGDSQALRDVSSLNSPRPADPATPPAAGFSRGAWTYTPERLDLARRLVREHAAWARVLQEINALPGRPVSSESALQASLAHHGITRSKLAAVRPEDGRVEVVRNSARPAVVTSAARVAPPAKPFAPPPAGLTERDGAISPAKLQLAQDVAQAEMVPMTLADACLWGARNGVKPLRGELPRETFKRVNEKRRQCGLPPFTLIRDRGPRDPLPEPEVGAQYDGAAA